MNKQHQGHFKLTPLLALLLAASAQAQMPAGMSVVAGQATAQLNGKQLTVTNANNTILNWQSFSIGAGNTVNFAQPSSTSQVLNRVTGNDPSAIFGSLTSNGRVWLLNPNGVLFGQGARVDVASLVTSTLNISNSDWLAGRALFTGGGAGSVVNQGEIRTTSGGRVALIGSASVSNEGLIAAPDGQIVLAAGQSVELVDTGAPNFAVKVTAPSGSAVNLGTLSGARVDVMAAAVNQQGIVEAQSIVLQADGRLTLASGSATHADGEQGGSVKLLGQTIELQDGSTVSANGTGSVNGGGGTVLVGGGAEGKDTSVPNAQGVYFAQGASISADALQSGDGGHIVLWADQATRAYGSLSAHAGASGGNGGLVETSGHWLDAKPAHLDVSSAFGKAGTWLLDPYDITISSAVSDSGYDPVTFTPNANNATISASAIQNALSNGNNVTISTSGGGTQNGDINVTNASINVQTPSNVTLTLDADRNITMSDATLTSSYGSLALVFKSGKSGAGSIWIDDSYFSTLGGAVTVGGYGPSNSAIGLPGQPDGIKVTRSTITTNGGTVTMNGYTNQSGGRGIGFDQSAAPNSIDAGNITLNGTSVNGTGVQIWSGDLNAGGAFTLTGTGGTVAVNIAYNGANSPVHVTGGYLAITGTSTGDWSGVQIDESAGPSSGSMLQGSGNPLQITASNPAGSSTPALYINAAANSGILSSGIDISLTATGGGMTLNNVSTAGAPPTFNANSDSSLQINSGSISAGTITIGGQYITLQGGLSLFATSSSGNGIIVSGYNGGAASTFRNAAGPQALMTEGSRYLIYVNDATDVEGVDLGGLFYDFQQYGAASANSNYSGNGLLSATVKTASISGTADTRAYDGTTNATVSNVVVTPEVSGDQAGSLSNYTASFSDKNAGANKAVQFNFSIDPSFTDSGGHPVYGYQLSSASLTGSITPAVLSASAAAANKVYDATTAATVSVNGITGLVGSETLNLSATGAFANKNVGTGKSVSVNYVLADGTNGGLASNYQFSPSASTVTANITPAALVISAQALDKVYDATTRALLGNTSFTPLGSDQVSLSGGTASFSDKNVGTGKSVLLSGYTLSGADAGNYQLSMPSSLTASITPLTIGATVTAQNKVYDGSVAATLSGIGFTPLGSDQVSLSGGTANFSDKNVGTGKSVFLSGYSLSGADAGNYQLSLPSSLTASITPLTIGATLTAQNKVYDGSVAATLSAIGFTPVSGDQVSLSSGSASFADKNVGTGKAVSLSGFNLTGADAGNYQLALPTGLTANITPAPINLAVTAQNKVYDGTTAVSVSNGSVTPISGDSLSLVVGLAAFSDRNAGTGKHVGLNGYSLAGADAANYLLVLPSVSANITPATLSYVADAAIVQEGAPWPPFTGAVTGFVGGDTQQSATSGSLAFSAGVSSSITPGIYAINGSGLSAGNYQFVQASGNATALTIVGGGPAATQAQTTVQIINNVQPVIVTPPNPTSSGLVDMTPVVAPAPAPSSSPSVQSAAAAQSTTTPSAAAASFDSMPISSMSPQAKVDSLGARSAFMQQTLSGGLGQLKSNPAAADVTPCRSLQEAAAGICLITPALKQQARAQGVTLAAAPSAPAPQMPSAAPSPGAPPAVAQAAPPVPQAVLPMFAQRRVKLAAVPEIRRKVAVLIGEGKYQDASIPALSNSVGDAHAVAATLSGQLGYETLVLDNPSKEMVISTLNRLALETGPQDSVVVYYAGHGAEVDASGQGYWLMSNSDASNAKTWLSNADIARLVQQIDARQVALISDSCYSGALVGGARIRATPGSVKPSEVLAKRATVVMSSGGNEPVFDSGRGGHSLFAWTLMDNLGKVKDWQLGGNVFERVRFAVARELPQRPQYGAAAGNAEGGDYLFEMRQLDAAASGAPGAE